MVNRSPFIFQTYTIQSTSICMYSCSRGAVSVASRKRQLGPDVHWIIDIERGETYLEESGDAHKCFPWDTPLQPGDVVIPAVYVFNPSSLREIFVEKVTMNCARRATSILPTG
eukprot:PhF_6_TR13453/c0_g2_i6/m.21548